MSSEPQRKSEDENAGIEKPTGEPRSIVGTFYKLGPGEDISRGRMSGNYPYTSNHLTATPSVHYVHLGT